MKKGAGICRICDRKIPDSHIDNLCDGCWECASRLLDFVRMPKGRVAVERALKGEQP